MITKWNRWPCEWPKHRTRVEIMLRNGAKEFGVFDSGNFYCEDSVAFMDGDVPAPYQPKEITHAS